MPIRNMVTAALLLAIFSVIGTGLVAYTFENTKQRIELNEKNALLHSLHELITPSSHDNDIFKDTIEVYSPDLLGSRKPVTVYRARMKGQPVAAVFTSIAPNGYSGAIKLLIGVRYDGTLAGVRVITHHETPGLGDAIEPERSGWILGFAGKSLKDPAEKNWKVKKDGGVFDQFTGATITPRAVVKAIRDTLVYFSNNRDKLFKQDLAKKPASTATPAKPDPAGGNHESR